MRNFNYSLVRNLEKHEIRSYPDCPQLNTYALHIKEVLEAGIKIDSHLYLLGVDFIDCLEEAKEVLREFECSISEESLLLKNVTQAHCKDYFPMVTSDAYHKLSNFNISRQCRAKFEEAQRRANTSQDMKPLYGSLTLTDFEPIKNKFLRLRKDMITNELIMQVDRKILLKSDQGDGDYPSVTKNHLENFYTALLSAQTWMSIRGESLKKGLKDEKLKKNLDAIISFSSAPASFPLPTTEEVCSIVQEIRRVGAAISATASTGQNTSSLAGASQLKSITITLSEANASLEKYENSIKSYRNAVYVINRHASDPSFQTLVKILILVEQNAEDASLLQELKAQNLEMFNALENHLTSDSRKDAQLKLCHNIKKETGCVLRADSITPIWVQTVKDGAEYIQELENFIRKATPLSTNTRPLQEALSAIGIEQGSISQILDIVTTVNKTAIRGSLLPGQPIAKLREISLLVDAQFPNAGGDVKSLDDAFLYIQCKDFQDNINEALASHSIITSYMHESFVRVVLTEALKLQTSLAADASRPANADGQSLIVDSLKSNEILDAIRAFPELYPKKLCEKLDALGETHINTDEIAGSVLQVCSDFAKDASQHASSDANCWTT